MNVSGFVPVKREPEQCLCIAVPTELGPCLQLQSQPRPLQPRTFPASPERRGASGKERPRKPCTRGGGRVLFFTQKKGEMLPWASTTHRHSLHLPFPVSDLGGRQSWLIQTRAGSHLAPRSGFPKQTATGNSSEIQKGNCSYHCPTHTHVPSSPPHPFLLGSRAEGLCCRAAPAHTHPRSRQSRHSGAARHGPGPAASETPPGSGRAGGAAPGPISRARPARALGLWLLMRMCRNGWAGLGGEER